MPAASTWAMSSDPKSSPLTRGSYHGYYNRRTFASDPRLDLLPSSIFTGKRVLDVGCNEGYVSCQIAQVYEADRVIGVDVDDSLVRAAWRRRRSVWSTQAPTSPDATTSSSIVYSDNDCHDDGDLPPTRESASFSGVEVGDDRHHPFPTTATSLSNKERVYNYFPMSCEHMFGPLPIPPKPESQSRRQIFPYNISFRTADWVHDGIPEDHAGYDVVVAFSVTKWIHVNGGDRGIRTFFERVYKVLHTGGTFVLEAQPWESYLKAKRRDETLKEKVKSLNLRPDEFASVLQQMGFSARKRLAPDRRRPVDLYIKL